MPCGVNRWKKESNCLVSAIVSKKDENGGEGDSREKNKKLSKKKMVKCESLAYIPREEEINNNHISVKEIVAKDSIAEETQFQDLWIKKRV